MRRIFPRKVNIIGHKYVWFGISGAVILAAIVALVVMGLNFGVDFTGGIQMDIRCEPGTSIGQVRATLAKFGYGDAQIQKSGKNDFIIRTSQLDVKESKELQEALEKDAGMTQLLEVNDVGPGWGAQVSRQALIALLVFLVAILLYISIRFEFKMAICAIVALFHDLLVTVGVYALTGREVSPATVIAVLTILGYSLYDTIVIFDRIKENADQLTRQSRETYSQMVNDSINQTLARSINTSLTTLVPIVTILLFGGETLKAFAFALFIGVIAGTYSSIFVASPILSVWKETEPKFRAFRDRVERKTAREARVAANSGKVEEAAAPAVASVGTEGQRVKAVAADTANTSAVSEKAGPVKAAPRPVPKPVKKQAVSHAKGSAKARTKGPGSGKKKKKKKKKR